ncbi:MAG: alpha/beta hydrolase, partial [Bacteroidota bacterium]
GTSEAMQKALKEPLPQLISGKTGSTKESGLEIWYHIREPQMAPQGSVLLVMGHSNTSLTWPEFFVGPLLEAGYRVILFDNRGCGLSDWVKSWNRKNAYTLEDMADDAIAVLNATHAEKAHIVGISMGGMIAQRMAINYPDRVQSLTSIMSSGFMEDPELPGVPAYFRNNFIRYTLKYGLNRTESNMLKYGIGVTALLKGDDTYQMNVERVAKRMMYEMRQRRGYNPRVGTQHSRAISLSGSRYAELNKITAPTLVIHGKADPLVKLAHGEKYAPMIPNAQTLWLDHMGHDIPEFLTGQIHEAMLANFNREVEA